MGFFLNRMKMYMKVDDVTGDVVTPSTYLGWIELDGLTWLGDPPRSSAGSLGADAKGVFREYPDFPNKTAKDGDVTVRAFPGKHSPQIFGMAQQGNRANVDIWVPMPHNKLLKARLSSVFVTAYISAGSGGGNAPTEIITFTAESGTLRAAP